MDNYEADALKPQPPLLSSAALPQVVGLCSAGRGWRGLQVWQQTCILAQEAVLPPMAAHHVVVQRQGVAHIAQRRDARVHSACWRRNDMALVPAGEPSAWQIKGAPDLIHVDIDCELMQRVVLETFDIQPAQILMQSVLYARDAEIGNLAYMLLQELGNSPGNGRFYAESLGCALAVRLAVKYSSLSQSLLDCRGSLPKHLLARCLDYIQSNLEANLSLQHLAKEAGYSAWHFARLFKQAMGMAPHRFVMNERVKRAKLLLQNTSLSKAEIALMAGFVDQSHLARVFKAHVGMLPREYRQQHLP